MIGFIFGTILGTLFGFTICACLVVGKDEK